MSCVNLFLILCVFIGTFFSVHLHAELSPGQIQFFVDKGYLVIEDFLSHEEINALLMETENLIENCHLEESLTPFLTDVSCKEQSYFINSGDKISYFFETGALDANGNLIIPMRNALNKIGHNLHDLNPVFQRITYQSKFKEIPRDLGWTAPSVMQSMIIFKQPFIGGAVPCHQDLTFLYTNPNTTLGFWIPLEDATLENGCLWLIPGGHNTTLRSLFLKNEESTKTFFVNLDEEPISEKDMIPIEMKKGSLILIHSLLPHKSLQNLSEKSRIAYSFHIIDRTSTYPSNNWLQRGEKAPLVAFE